MFHHILNMIEMAKARKNKSVAGMMSAKA